MHSVLRQFIFLRERTRHVCKATNIILFKQLIKFSWHFLLWLKLCDSEMVKMCIKFSLFKGKICSHIQDSFPYYQIIGVVCTCMRSLFIRLVPFSGVGDFPPCL